MERLNVKQEAMGEEMMDIGSDFSQEFVDLESMDGLQMEINLRKGVSDGGGESRSGRPAYAVVSSSSTQGNQIRLVSLANNQPGDQRVIMQNNQIVMSSGKDQTGNDSQKPMTKLIIAKNTAGGPPQVLSVGPQGLHPVNTNSVNRGYVGQSNATSLHSYTSNSNSLIGQPNVASASQVSSSPTRTYTLSQSGMLSPGQKLTSTTPTKFTIQPSRMPGSPAKTPPRMMSIPMSSLQKSPQKIVQVAGQQYVMLTRPQTSQTSRPSSVSVSPSKVVIKGHSSSFSANQYVSGQTQSMGRSSSASAVVTLSNMPSNVQPVSVSGSKFQYVRLVTTPASQSQPSIASRPPTIAPAPQRGPAPLSLASAAPTRLAMPSTNQNIQVIQPKQSSQSQRLILPATTNIAGPTIRQSGPTSSNAILSSGMNAGQTISLQGLAGLQGFALIPAQYIAQNQSQATPPVQQSKPEVYHQPVQHQPAPKHTTSSVNGSTTESQSQRPRKPCNCTKSQCLKLYCDCFANGEFCSNCNCNNCFNNLDHEEERQRAIKTCLERNPHAFHPKIGKGRVGGSDRRHNKGCNCKRSGCLKNYCECYEAKIMCSNLCKCVGCKNFEESPDRKTLMHLADAAEVRHQQQTNVKTKLSTQIQDLPMRSNPPLNGERLPYSFVTAEVAEATCACLVAQAEEAERTRQQEMMEERMILEEFGRCLMQVIQSSTRTKAPSPVP